jgi:hypothetical protein
MTQDEIIEMGIKADLCDKYGDINWEYGYLKEIVAFAKLVAQHEREACIVDIQMHIPRSGHDTPEMLFAKKVMERIRAREQA